MCYLPGDSSSHGEPAHTAEPSCSKFWLLVCALRPCCSLFLSLNILLSSCLGVCRVPGVVALSTLQVAHITEAAPHMDHSIDNPHPTLAALKLLSSWL